MRLSSYLGRHKLLVLQKLCWCVAVGSALMLGDLVLMEVYPLQSLVISCFAYGNSC